jgi:hypothetical protein
MASYAYTIEYFNEYNQNYNCITAISFNASFNQESSFLMNEPVYTEKYDGTRIDYGTRYSEVAEVLINLVKKDYSDFTNAEKRAILRWLTARKQNSWLKLYDQDGEEICEYYGRFTMVEEQTADSRVIGFTCTFTSTHPYAFSPIRDVQQTFTGKEQIVVENDSDVVDNVVRPYMVIKPNKSISQLSIKNETTNIITYVKNIKANETLVIDNENKLAYSDNVYRTLGSDFYGDVDGFVTNYPVWIELVPGDNKLIFDAGDTSTKVEYTIKYRYPIKIGSTF